MRFSGFSATLRALAGGWWLLALAVPAGAGVSAPAEAPPPGFRGAQYIDSGGCVFVRTEERWQPRVARDGEPICGYPPTFSARRTSPEATVALAAPPEEPRARRIERELTEAIITNLHAGELATDADAPAMPGSEPATPPRVLATGESGALQPAAAPVFAAVAAVPALRAGLAAGATPASRLCSLLDAESGRVPRLGGDPALGLCDARPLKMARLRASPDAAGRKVAGHGTEAASPAGQAVPKPAAKSTARQKAAPAGRKAAGREAARPGSSTARSPGMIPPGARFIQVGAFADPANGERAARNLSRLGLPVARQHVRGSNRQLQVILAGPFEGREAVVRALDRVRKAGFSGAYARR